MDFYKCILGSFLVQYEYRSVPGRPTGNSQILENKPFRNWEVCFFTSWVTEIWEDLFAIFLKESDFVDKQGVHFLFLDMNLKQNNN